MKKILVILLVLAVATGVFAQGQWSIGGGVEIGARIDLDTGGAGPANVTTHSSGYQYPYSYYTSTHGYTSIGYTNGPMSANLVFDTGKANALSGDNAGNGFDRGLKGGITGKGDNYEFAAEAKLLGQNVNNTTGGLLSTNVATDDVKRLWGWYEMVNGMVHLEVAIKGRGGASWWESDTTGSYMGGASGSSGIAGTQDRGLFKAGKTFTAIDGENFILGNLTIGGLEIGLVAPSLFFSNQITGNRDGELAQLDTAQSPNKVFLIGPSASNPGVLRLMVFGAKFAMSPLEIAVQAKMQDYGVYMGGKAFFGPITTGLSFMGEFPDGGTRKMQAGLSVDFNGGSFGGGVKGWLYNQNKNKSGGTGAETIIGVEPSFFINAIPAYMSFVLNAGFYFDSLTNNTTKEALEVYWGVQPEIYWNFLGTGAARGYHSLNTGMIFRYRVFKGKGAQGGTITGGGSADKVDGTNALDLCFKFGL